MAPGIPGTADSDEENGMKVDKEEENSNDQGSDAGEEEYEIEEILDAKRGAFPEGRMGYLVKWKGYGPEENSWVDELDTENAKELVDEFWKKNPRKRQPRKSMEPKTTKRGRRSAVNDDESDTNSAAKKRGRKSTTRIDSDEDEQGTPWNKRTKKAGGPYSNANQQETIQSYTTMARYMDRETWEDLVDTVDTVERTDEGLMVFFTLKTGENIREKGSICRKRFPQKLLTFYESNLKWRMMEAGDS